MTFFPDILIIVRAALNALVLFCGVSLIGFAYLPRAWQPRRPSLAILLATSWGMTFTSLAVWLAGGLFGTSSILPAVILLFLPSLRRFGEWWQKVNRALCNGWKLVKSSPAAAGTLLLPILFCLPLLLLPVIDSDGLRYHLALPKLFLLVGHIFRYPWDITGAYPQGADMLYLVELLLGPAEAAKFLHFFLFLSSITTIVLMVRKEKDNRHGAFIGGLLYAVSPVVLAIAGAAFIDNFVIFHLGSACLLLRFRARPVTVGLVLAGAAWTKWTVAPGLIGCLVLLLFQAQAGKKIRSLLAAVIPVVLVMAPLLVRNTISTGDPFYPVLTGFLRGGVADVDAEAYRYVTRRHEALPGPMKIPWGSSLGKIEWDEVVGWHHLLGLVLLPLALRRRRSRIAAAVILPYLLFEIWFHPSVRLTMPFIWGLAVAEGQLLSQWRPGRALLVSLLAAIPLLIFTGSSILKTPALYIGGTINRQQVEQRVIPGWYAADFVNKWPGKGRVLAMDFPAPYLFKRPWLAEGLVNKPPLRMWLDRAGSSTDLIERIKQNRITLIVVTPGYGGGQPFAFLPLAKTEREAGMLGELRRRLKLVFSKNSVDVYFFRD